MLQLTMADLVKVILVTHHIKQSTKNDHIRYKPHIPQCYFPFIYILSGYIQLDFTRANGLLKHVLFDSRFTKSLVFPNNLW